MRSLLLTLSVLLLTGCWGNVVTEFPSGLEPLEENKAPLPSATANEPTPEEMRFVGGDGERASFGHLSGYVHAPIDKVWEAMREVEINANRRAARSYERRPLFGSMPDVTHSYVLRMIVDGLITAEYDITWRHGLAAGSIDDPEVVAIRYQKTWGLSLIEVLEGSIVLTRLDDERTQIEMIQHLRAPTVGYGTIQVHLEDMYAETVEYCHGRPLPQY